MRKTCIFLLLCAMAITLVMPALAQSDQSMKNGPPPVIRIFREQVKPGMVAQHQMHEAQWMQALAKAQYPNIIFTISSMTGAPEEWFMSGYGSMTEWAKEAKMFEADPAMVAIDGRFSPKEQDYLAETRTVTAQLRPDLSFHPDEMKMGDIRFMNVGILRMRMGVDPMEAMKMLNQARQRAGVGGATITYEVTSGMPSGTFLFFDPYRSIADMEKTDKAMNEAVGPQGWEQFMKLISTQVATYESRIFSVNPRLSIVTKEVAAADPAFWHPKPMVAAKSPKTEVTPAAKKEIKK